MGGGSSVEDKRYSRLFQEGLKALHEGRFTYAEIYFDQAIEKHEGYPFWQRLDEMVEWERKGNTGKRKGEEQNEKDQWAKETKPETGGGEGAGEDGAEMDDLGGESDDTGVLVIPLDQRVFHVLEYLQLRTDISVAYLLAERYEEAHEHLQYVTSHTHVLLKCLRIARQSNMSEESGGEGGDTNPLEHVGVVERRFRAGLMGMEVEVEGILDAFEQYLRLHWFSGIANTVYIAFERFKGGQGDKKRKRELDAVVVTCETAKLELHKLVSRRAKSLTNSVLIEFLEKLINDMDSSASDSEDDGNANGGRSGGPAAKGRRKSDNREDGDKEELENFPFSARLQMLYERRLLYRGMPAPMQGAALRYLPWMDEDIRRVVPGTNYNLEIQCGMIDDRRKKQLQKKSLKHTVQKRFDFNDRVLFNKSMDEENALLLFPLLLVEADVQLELGAATKGIKALHMVEKLSTQLYGRQSLEQQSLMRRVLETRKRGGALFMMFDDQLN
ncbi:hypothetical protein DPX39_070064200 [Trypanosoma brucei equiperdum]|uniref:Sodium stibogluconate resistance protein n=1 Tax=Trypanosoma brucei equiperdum TaxID=630700 RepID=A0A3L6L6X8_9TRYP|nr:hypothetical protein DPX39_070064200 [Trypanosoma brucei equiperdum]